MICRQHHHCLSRNIPHSGVHRVCPFMTILILDSQSSKNIDPLRLLLSWMPYHILKEYWLPDAYPIIHSFFPSEDKNVVSISPSQLGRIYQPNQTCLSSIQASCAEVISSICQLPTHQWRYIVAAAHHFALPLEYSDTCCSYALSFQETLDLQTNVYFWSF